MAWPTTDDPKDQFVTVRFTLGESIAIDRAAARLGKKSRSAMVRDCVSQVLAAEAGLTGDDE